MVICYACVFSLSLSVTFLLLRSLHEKLYVYPRVLCETVKDFVAKVGTAHQEEETEEDTIAKKVYQLLNFSPKKLRLCFSGTKPPPRIQPPPPAHPNFSLFFRVLTKKIYHTWQFGLSTAICFPVCINKAKTYLQYYVFDQFTQKQPDKHKRAKRLHVPKTFLYSVFVKSFWSSKDF